MTRDPGSSEHSKDEILAGEYVLGVLSIEGRRMVERRMAGDEAFSQIVARWQADMESFNQDYDEVTPRAAVLEQLEQRLFAAPLTSNASLWNSMAFWRWLSLGTSVAAAAALIYASGIASPPSRDGKLVAELSAPSNSVNMLASYDAEKRANAHRTCRGRARAGEIAGALACPWARRSLLARHIAGRYRRRTGHSIGPA